MPASSPCTCFRLRRAARRLTQLYDQALAPAGLTLNQYSILRRTGQPVAMGALADALGMDRTTLTRNLRPLVQAGWLRERPGQDARVRLCALTAAGQRRLDAAMPLWQRAQERVRASYGATPLQHLHQALDALDDALPAGTAA